MLSARKSPTSVLYIVEERSKAKSGSRRVQAWWKTVECSRREMTGVRLREHVKVTGPRVPARQTLDVVGQDDRAGRYRWEASLGQRDSAAQHSTGRRVVVVVERSGAL